MSNHRFELAYRTGGTENAKWHRVLDTFTAEQAAAKQAEIERMGYKCLRYKAGTLDILGLPEGWDANSPIA